MITIGTEKDMSIEPGHQWLVVLNDTKGKSLARLLLSTDDLFPYLELVEKSKDNPIGQVLKIPHTAEVDERVRALIDVLSHVRFSAPGLVQLTMEDAKE